MDPVLELKAAADEAKAAKVASAADKVSKKAAADAAVAASADSDAVDAKNQKALEAAVAELVAGANKFYLGK